MSQAKHLPTAAQRLVAYMNLSYAILAINLGGAATVKTTNAINYVAGGIVKTKAALAAQALTALSDTDITGYAQPNGLQAFYTLPASKTCYIVLVINAAGTVRAIQGTYDAQILGPASGYTQTGKSVVPDVPEEWTAFGMIKVVTGATTFLPGTDALDKASVTFTFYDLAFAPVASAP